MLLAVLLLFAASGELPFDLGTDVRREQTAAYDRVTTYLLDPEGRVLEIFPAHRRLWLPWDAVLHRIDALQR